MYAWHLQAFVLISCVHGVYRCLTLTPGGRGVQ